MHINLYTNTHTYIYIYKIIKQYIKHFYIYYNIDIPYIKLKKMSFHHEKIMRELSYSLSIFHFFIKHFRSI